MGEPAWIDRTTGRAWVVQAGPFPSVEVAEAWATAHAPGEEWEVLDKARDALVERKVPGEVVAGTGDKPTTKLREWRTSARLTLDEVSGLTGVSTAMLSLVERGIRDLAPLTKIQVSRGLGVSIRDLFDPPDVAWKPSGTDD
jgi:DNA-binding XRE family transcriptional regulator